MSDNNNDTTIVKNIYTDGSRIDELRKDLTRETWEAGIRLQLNNLTTIAPFQSSKPVIDALSNSGHETLIVPSQPNDTSTLPVEGTRFSKRRQNWSEATPDGMPPLVCADANEHIDHTGTPLPHVQKGSGRGSDTVTEFTPQDYIKTDCLPGGRPDEVLLHEMVHALRMQMGLNLCMAMDNGYDTVEEFYAILIANIYRAECGYRSLRANHGGKEKLPEELTDDRKFYKRWKEQIDTLTRQMPALCNTLSIVPSWYNPIRRAKAA